MLLIRRLTVSALLLVPLPARAERPHDAVTLDYLPSPATVAFCPDADFLAFEVELRLGYELVQPSAPNHLTVKLDRINGQFRARGEVRDDAGKLIFDGTLVAIDCTRVVVFMALGVAIWFTNYPEPPEPSPPAVSPPPLTSLPPPPRPPASAPGLSPPAIVPPRVPERPRFQAGIGADFSVGLAPTVVGGVGVSLGVRWPRASLSLEGRALSAPSVTIEQVTVRQGYHSTVIAVGATGCYHPAWFFLCARIEAGSLSFGNPDVDNDPLHFSNLAMGFRFGGERALTPWLALRAYVQAQAQSGPNTLRDRRDTPIVWPQPQLSGSIGLGPVFTFSEF